MSAALALAACTTAPQGALVTETPGDPIPDPFPFSAFAEQCEDWDEWEKPAPVVRIYGGTYLVGTCGISSVLITTPEGHVLLDAGTERGAELILDNVRRAGFSPRNIRYLAFSHEHYDHVGGMAAIKQASGATLVSSPQAAPVMGTGQVMEDDPQHGTHDAFTPIAPDEVLVTSQPIEVADLIVTPLATPGHTPGALSWQWIDCEGLDDNRTCLSIVYADSLSPVSAEGYRFSDHPDYLAAYRAGLDALAELPCDILLTPHPSASDMIDRFAGDADILDETACQRYADEVRRRLDQRIEEETAML
ncbi:subclass B3 metallo-beta-lactamase [Sphingomicrobium sediminis]|uniref:Subclass B3 metallo-beta-lactamase n=1 Tax=Sphingomicrobium sediminis TaxID=2950949 RepID=A0A9X2ELK5_9SPHN|nr:subclass B3 metallo-beta-lactamase [Sphingomicrobium sediminis]MCM8557719.1 subclass B3 metallo-beta-lactamase [Sphingomicrobium sediminis]